jgi:hypothetical protein
VPAFFYSPCVFSFAEMRITGLILSFYLIMLAVVPCCAVDNCPEDKTEQTANHEKGDDDCGACSPFFSCEGCAAASMVYEPVQFDFTLPANSPVYTTYQTILLSEADLDFWQPPKIG